VRLRVNGSGNAMNLLVRGGTVVDGTGAAAVRADVRVRNGRIAEVGAQLRPDGEPVVDASGAYVTPGLIESHTHYDAAVWWDPNCDPMPAHGCTTMVLANCGLGLAPLRSSAKDDLVDLFAFIEDIPSEAFQLAVPWTWTTWPEYHGVAAQHATAVNSVGFVPHQMLRTWVMGPEAWDRAATDEERAQLCAVLDEALTAGGLGLSTSVMDTDRANRLVPSRLADDAEFAALLAVLARHGAVLQYVPRILQPEYFIGDLERVATLATQAGVRMLFAGYKLEEAAGEHRAELRAFLERFQSRATPIWANFSVRPTHVNMHFERSIMWSGVEAWHDVVNSAPDKQRRSLEDPGWRDRARAEWDNCAYTLVPIHSPDRLLLIGGVRSGESLAAAAARGGQHPSDALADWLLATDLTGNIRTTHRPIDDVAAVELVRDAHSLSGASDAGAHVQMFSGAGDSTYLLSHLVRDTGAITVEEAVHAVTAKQARFFGIPDRGVIRRGAVADLAVFALDDLDPGTEVRRDDLPGGAWRYSRTPGGYRATVVAGTPTWLDGASTGRRPGAMLAGRSGVAPLS
jgi:N-acyl-D-amino-acid deacylase